MIGTTVLALMSRLIAHFVYCEKLLKPISPRHISLPYVRGKKIQYEKFKLIIFVTEAAS